MDYDMLNINNFVIIRYIIINAQNDIFTVAVDIADHIYLGRTTLCEMIFFLAFIACFSPCWAGFFFFVCDCPNKICILTKLWAYMKFPCGWYKTPMACMSI